MIMATKLLGTFKILKIRGRKGAWKEKATKS
jgi:hypothetical protein